MPNGSNSNLVVSEPGEYKVQVKVDDCLSAFSNPFPIIITGDVNSSRTEIRLFPNPVGNKLEIAGVNESIEELSAVDLFGRIVKLPVEQNGEMYQTDVSNLSSGPYMLTIKSGQTIHKIRFIRK